jgi:hypothetical protein
MPCLSNALNYTPSTVGTMVFNRRLVTLTRKLLDSVSDMVPVFLRRWDIQSFLHSVIFTGQ